MLFKEQDFQGFALPLGEGPKEKCLAILAEIVQALKGMGYTLVKTSGHGVLDQYNAVFQGTGGEELYLLPLGSYGNDTRGDKREPLELALITAEPMEELGALLAFRLQGGWSEKDKGIGTIFMDIGPAGVTVIRLGYRIPYDSKQGARLFWDGRIMSCWPELERKLGSEKARATNYAYRKVVRVVKKLRELLREQEQEAAQRVEPLILESLLLDLEQEAFDRYESLSLKVAYCSIRLSLLLERAPASLKKVDGSPILQNPEEIQLYQDFFKEVTGLCELKPE